LTAPAKIRVRRQIRVLHVEDNPLDAMLVARALQKAGYDIDLSRVQTEEEYRAALESIPEIVICDYALPQFDGLRALEILKQTHPEIPFILVTGTIGEEKAAEITRLGASDYLLKEHLARLPVAVEKAVQEAEQHAAAQKAKAEAEAGLRRAQAMAKLAHVITGPDGVFESWSETLPELAGVEPGGLAPTTRVWMQLVHPEDRDTFRSRAIEAARKKQRTDVAYRLQRPDGALIHVRQTMEPLGGPEADTERWFNTLQDVTEIVAAQDRIRRLNRVYAVLSGINSAIVRIRDRQELFQESCRIAVEAGRFVVAWIGIADSDAVKPVAFAGTPSGTLDPSALALLGAEREGESLAVQAVRSKAPVISNDTRDDPRKPTLAELERHGIRALALVPLIVQERAAGVLALYAADAGFFDHEEMRLLAELAGDVSFALDHIEKAEKLDYLSYYDPLTGAPNRALFHERLRLQIEDAARDKAKLALLLADIERFKTINDTFGRHAGDALLREIAGRTRQALRPPTWFARVGPDHFAFVLPEIASEEELGRRIEKRVGEIFGAPFTVAGNEVSISARAGIAMFPGDGADADTLFRNAEAALKRAKTTGERYLFYTSEMTERVAERLSLENKLRKALAREEFVLHYQPKLRLENMAIVGVEALIRWRSPELGLVPPAKFVPLLEETGLILQVGAWALGRAALDYRAWVEQRLKAPRIAVNVSSLQLQQRDFVRVVEDAINGAAAPAFIDLEITESLIMANVEANIEKLNAVRALGMSVAIDDFGTGYSSLAYLAKLPVQALKIDRAFVHSMQDDANALTLVQAIVSMGHSLGLTVIAEGVETAEQAKILRLLHCDEMQGFVFSKPLPQEQLVAMLR
jgi:diguanylate cyclase (GGDEF)-like protein/PAS domain S-box-containing protein